MRKSLIAAFVVVCLAVIGGAMAIHSSKIDMWLFKMAVEHAVAGGDAKLADAHELSVLLVGTGSPLPDKSRAGPSTLIAAGDHLYLVDTGIDCARNLLLWKVPLAKIDGILITHFHSDHIGELGEIRLQTWVAGRKTPLKVYGPPGIERVVAGFNEAYALDDGYRTKHHGAAMLPPDAVALVPVVVPMAAGATTAPVFDRDGLKVTAIEVHHEPATPAYGYRFDFAGRSVTVSGDTVMDMDLAKAAQGSDVLVHEALQSQMVGIMHDALIDNGRPRPAKIMHDIPGYHTSPVDAAKIANAAHARLLVYTHLLPILPNWIAVRAFLAGVEDVRPAGVDVGYDGMIVRLPGHSDTIEKGDLN